MLLTGMPAPRASNERLAARLSHESPRNCVTSLTIAAKGLVDSASALHLDCTSHIIRWLGRAGRWFLTGIGISGRWTSYQGSPARTRDTNLAIRVGIPRESGSFELCISSFRPSFSVGVPLGEFT
jgi:hypothetical protein